MDNMYGWMDGQCVSNDICMDKIRIGEIIYE